MVARFIKTYLEFLPNKRIKVSFKGQDGFVF